MIDKTNINGGYKTTELGILPEEWEVKKISDVADFTKKPRALLINPNQILPFISMEMIPENNDSIPQWQEKRYSDISSGNFVFKGDLIVAKITPCFENGKQAILDNLPTDYAYTTTEIWPMHPKDNRLFIDFLANYLRDSPIRKELTAKMEGSTNRQRLPREALQNLLIPLPPLPEQHAIAATLRSVQEAKERTDAVIAATKALKAAMMKHLFTYGPVPAEEAEMVALKETEIGPVPEGWDVARFSEVVDIAKGQIDPTKEPYKRLLHIGPENIVPGTGQVVGMKTAGDIGLISGQFYFTSEQVIYSKIRPYLKKAAFPKIEGTCSADMYPLKPKDDRLSSEFLFQYLLSDKFSNDAISFQDRTGIPKINRQQLGLINLPRPPLKIQQQIASILFNIDQKLAAEQSRKEALDTLFASLLHDLMTAKIRVNPDRLS